ncbi:MAG: sulfite exporter TauE/SafE family protein [Atribacterota bacterium]|nr:sulfite exporter TauE/SafE family protein [Atribacterota bacterium]
MIIFSITVLTLIASVIGTITGFGISTVMIPVLAIFFPPIEAIFLVSIIHWFGNLWKIVLFRKGFNLRLLLLFGLTGFLTSYLGASLSLGSNEEILLRILGIFLFGYALFLILQSDFRVPAVNTTALLGGSLSGFFAGVFGIGGAIRSMFLSAFNLPKEVYIATAGAIGLLVDSTRIVTYFAGGAQLSELLWWGLPLFIATSFIGAKIARQIVDRIPQSKFRFIISFFLSAVGVKLAIWP